jgi:Amt family ammonium transporter
MGKKLKRSLIILLLLFVGIPAIYAGDIAHIDTGATAWMLTSTALVLLMVP